MNKREFNLEGFTNEQFIAGGVTLFLSGLIGFFGNILVLIVTYRILRFRKNIPNVLILFLAWTDLLIFPLAYPQSLLKYFFGVYYGDYIACDYQATVLTFLYTVSISLVLIMSVDRLLALHKPFCYQKYITYDKEKVKIAAIGLGMTTLTISLLPALGIGRNVLHFPGTFCLFEWGTDSMDGKALVYSYMTLLSFSMLAIVFSNFCVVVLTWRLMRRVQCTPHQKENLEMGRKNSKEEPAQAEVKKSEQPDIEITSMARSGAMEMQFAKLSSAMALTFVCCWGLFLIRITMIQCGFPRNEFLDFTAVRLAALHSVVNPWIYPLLRRKYRDGFWYILSLIVHYCTCTLVSKPDTTLDEIIEANPAAIQALELKKEKRRRSSAQRLVNSSASAQ